ncbi:MAG: hypothetical protein LBS92_04770 [Candidatus Methanoplasma sp.]|jgi:hypothetical protein|nr:hypothetical protein [Candidatus Methanoplasma sp.]
MPVVDLELNGSKMRMGPPTNAVMAPTGSIIGAIAVFADRSTTERMHAP